MRKLFVIFVVSLAFICGLLIWLNRYAIFNVPISNILANPRAYDNKLLVVSGTVTERLSLFRLKVFIIKDNTGQIPVVTDKIVPPINANIRVKGFVQEAFSIGDNQMLVIKENNTKD